MRIGVIGVGGVGAVFAAKLHEAGHDVAVAVRSWTVETVEEYGVRLTGAFGDLDAMVQADAVLPPDRELVLVATKAHDAAVALELNRDAIGDAPVVVLQNGLGGITTARAQLGRTRGVFGGLALFAATNEGAARVRVTAAGDTYIGVGPGRATATTTRLAAVMNEGAPTSAIGNFRGALWTKLLVNQVNAIPAITGLSVQEVSADPALCRVLTRSMRETINVGLRLHVTFVSLGPLTRRDIAGLRYLPLRLATSIPRRLGQSFGCEPNYASTLQSIRRGQPTEIDSLNGHIASLGRRHGVGTPVNRMLTALVHRVEQTGEFLAPHLLVRLVEA